MVVYNTNGIPSETPNENVFYIYESSIGEYIFNREDKTKEIENRCNELRNKLAIKIFGSIERYHQLLPSPIYPVVALMGIDAEAKISKEEFEKFLRTFKDQELLNKCLYFFDTENIISTIQNSVLETKVLIGEFYKELNQNSFLVLPNYTTVETGFQYASGFHVTRLTSTVNHLFINLYSQMDFVTKLIYEFENLHIDFNKYPKLKSKDIQFGDSKKTSFKDKKDTLFELTDNIRIIMYLRNEIVHNASIDNIPKVYQNIADKKIIEKFVLLPDFDKGIIKSFVNRKRFFDQDTKLNEILPDMISEFWTKLLQTLVEIK